MCGAGGGSGGFLKMAAPLLGAVTGNPLGIAMALGGTLLNAKMQSDANDDRQQAIARSIQRQGEHDAEIVRKVNEFLPQMDAEARTASFQEAEQEQTDRLAASLAAARERGVGGEVSTNPAGRVSENFQVAEAQAMKESIADAAKLAQLIGRVRAPMVMNQEEGFIQARLGSDVGQQRNFARGDRIADDVAIDASGQVSPIGTAVAGLMQGVGTGMMSRAAMGSTTPTAGTVAAAPAGGGVVHPLAGVNVGAGLSGGVGVGNIARPAPAGVPGVITRKPLS